MPSKKKSVKSDVRPFSLYVLTALAVLLLNYTAAKADNRFWTGGAGSWMLNSNWGGTRPTSSDYAYIDNGGTAIVSSGAVCDALFLGGDDTGSVQLEGGSLSGGSNTPYGCYVGYTGNGTFTQSNGTNETSILTLSMSYGLTGTYELSGGDLTSSLFEYVGGMEGSGGLGTFNHSGGTNAASYLFIGNVTGDTTDPNIGGYYNLSDTGELIVSADAHVGMFGPGGFTHSGGGNTVATLYIGTEGAYDYYCSESDEFPPIYAENYMYSVAGGSGTYELNGMGASLNVMNEEYVGYGGTGTFTHSDGDHQLGTLYLGYSGAYSVIDGGFNGTELWGTYWASRRDYAAAQGNYLLSGTGYLDAVEEYVGYSGTGIFSQSGGLNNAGALVLGQESGSSGTYNLTGGLLVVGSLSKGYGAAAFKFGGGTLGASGNFSTSLDMILTGDGGDANIDTSGYTVNYTITLSGDLSGDGGLNKLGSGTLILNGDNTYQGDTYVYAGILELNGSLDGGGSVFVRENAFLSGTGTAGNVIVNSGGHIAPGTPVGTLTLTGNLHLDDGALLDFELGAPSAGDLISMPVSTLFLHGLDFSDFTFTALNGFQAGTYTLIDAGTISGDLGTDLSGIIGGFSAYLSKSASGGDLILTVAVVPEPSIFVLFSVAAVALAFYKWRRR